MSHHLKADTLLKEFLTLAQYHPEVIVDMGPVLFGKACRLFRRETTRRNRIGLDGEKRLQAERERAAKSDKAKARAKSGAVPMTTSLNTGINARIRASARESYLKAMSGEKPPPGE